MLSIRATGSENEYPLLLVSPGLRDRTATAHLLPPDPSQVLDRFALPPADAVVSPPLGTIVWPAFGATRFAVGHLLLDYYSLGQLRTDLGTSTAVELLFTDDPDDEMESPRIVKMHLLSTRPLSKTDGLSAPPDPAPDEDDGYVLTLVDQRWFWRYRKVDVVSQSSWMTLFHDLATAGGFNSGLVIDTIPAAYKTPGETWKVVKGYSVAHLVESAAGYVGARVIVDPSTEVVTIRQPDLTDRTSLITWHTDQETDQRNCGGGLLDDLDNYRAVPHAVVVAFPPIVSGTTHVESKVLGTDVVIAEYGGIEGKSDDQCILWSHLKNTDGGTSALATALATSWYTWQLVPIDSTYCGFVLPDPDTYGFIGTIQWVHDVDAGYTRVRRPPINYPSTFVFFTDKSSTSGSGECTSCAWLSDVPLEPTPPYPPCLLLKMRGGAGRCDCIDSDPTDDDSGIVLWYDTLSLSWIGVARMDAGGNIVTGGSAMPETCCGCGVAKFQITDPDLLEATLVFSGIHTSCPEGSGSGPGDIFTLTLHQECCGTDPDTGRHYVEFWGKGTDPCNSDVAPCDNTFHVRVECNVGCPSGACGCTGCGPESSPFVWLATITGFDDNDWNGDWAWVPAGDPDDPCAFTASCNDHTSTLTFDPGAGMAGQWTLVHDGITYTVDFTPGQCGGPITLTTGAGAGHPTTITLTPYGGDDPDVVCCQGCDRNAIIALGTVYATISATGTCLDGRTIALIYNPMTDRFESGDIREDCTCDCDGTYFMDWQCSDNTFTFNSTTHCGPSITDVVLVGTPVCSPYLAEFTACISACTLPCVSGTITISEIAP